MAVQKIGGQDLAGAVVPTTLGSVFTIPDGQRLTVYDVDVSALVATTVTLESSSDGGATFTTIEGEWHLASAGVFGRSYNKDKTPLTDLFGSGTDVQVRLRYLQAAAGRVTAFVIAELV